LIYLFIVLNATFIYMMATSLSGRRSRNSKDRQNNAQNKKGQIQTMIYKTLHRKPKIE